MRRAFIRLAVDLALAENGYPVSLYGWKKPGWLEVWTGDADEKPILLHLPAIARFKKDDLLEALGTLRPIGLPLEAPIRTELVTEGEQLELEAFIRSLDAEKQTASVVTAADLKAGVEALRANDKVETYA